MDRVKLHQNDIKTIPVTKEEFESNTKKARPYFQIDKNGEHCYAICPYCGNPVQLIGLYKKIERVPYGAHTGKNIPGLPAWNQGNYMSCIYSQPGHHIDKDARRATVTPEMRLIYQTLREHFPEACAVIKRGMGFYFSDDELCEFLQQFVNSRGWLYPRTTVYNVPYMLIYLGENPSVWGRLIRKQNPLVRKISTDNDLILDVVDGNVGKSYYRFSTNQNCGYIELGLTFYDHVVKADNYGLDESIKVELAKNKNGKGFPRENWDVVATDNIKIDQNYYERLILSSAGKKIRQSGKHLSIRAQNIMPATMP